jgi:hypothetical protein
VVLDTGLWEAEFEGVVGQIYGSNATVTGSFSLGNQTVSGTPTITMRTEYLYYQGTSINSTGTASFGGSAVSFSASTVIPAVTAGTSRYVRLWYKTRFRINGTGASIRLYPTLSTTAVTDNVFFLSANSKFRVVKVDDSATGTGNMAVVS